ncbi:MAG TPA: hypothetical protein VFH95_15110 [Candidatus Kapabacteria bacterium]|nr:hypothetical protein [Candidatus Kapabacteria bacterium]
MKRNHLKATIYRLVALAMVAAFPLLGSVGSANAQTTSVLAPQSRTISYQGLLKQNGSAVPDGNYTVRLTLYDDASGTSKVWQGTYTVHTQDGIFDVLLGSGSSPFPAPPAMDGALWLGVKIGEGAELPLTPLAASAYAMNVADSSITAKKMATDYVGSISVNGQKVTGTGGNLNLVGTNGISLQLDRTTNSLYLSGSGASGTNSGKGAQPLSNVVHAITGTTNQVSVDGSYTSAKTDSVTLGLPQDIATSSSPTFSDLTLDGLTHFSSPSQVSGILAVNGSNLVGYRTPAEIFGAAANNWILNQATPQTANFNITGNGVIGGSLGFGTSSPAGQLANTNGNDVTNSVGENSQSFHWADAQTGWTAYLKNTGTSGSSNGLAIYLADNTSASDAFHVESYYHQLFDVDGAGAVTIGQLGTGVVSATNGLLSAGNISEGEVTNLNSDLGTLTTNLNNEVSRATTAEGTLTTNLNNEVARATASEATKLPLAGGTMTGAIDMDNHAINNVSELTVGGTSIPNVVVDGSSNVGTWLSLGNASTGGHWFDIISTGTNNSEGAGKLLFMRANYANQTAGQILTLDWATSSITAGGNLDMGNHPINNVTDPTNAQDAATKDYVDNGIATETTRAEAAESTKLPLAGGTMTGAINMGTSGITNMANPTNAQDAATKSYVDSRAAGVIPIGGIIMWSGTVSNIPAGWALCDGNTYNGHATPNLKDRFIVGAGGTYAVGSTGGSTQAPYTASGILTTSASGTGISLGASGPFAFVLSDGHFSTTGSLCTCGLQWDYESNVYTNQYINDPGHSHTVNASGITLSTTSSLPPYYAMAYIMRVQ